MTNDSADFLPVFPNTDPMRTSNSFSHPMIAPPTRMMIAPNTLDDEQGWLMMTCNSFSHPMNAPHSLGVELPLVLKIAEHSLGFGRAASPLSLRID